MIPGIVGNYHTRDRWEDPDYRIADDDPPAQRPHDIDQAVLHYSADSTIPTSEQGLADWFAGMQRYYSTVRGYAIGYLFGVDHRGDVWELRGFDYKSAANAGHNDHTCPVIFTTTPGQPATPEAWESARAVWREFRYRSGRSDFNNRAVGHGHLTGAATACPGVALRDQLIVEGDINKDSETGAPIVATETEILSPPVRILDSRDFGAEDGRLGSERDGDNGRRTIGVPDSTGVLAIEATFTAVGPAGGGFLTAWAGGNPVPEVSCLNWDDSTEAIANSVTVPMGIGAFEILLHGDAHLVIDLVAKLR